MTVNNLCIVTPVFNVWESFNILCSNLSNLATTSLKHYRITILAINDCSSEKVDVNAFNNIAIKVVNLKINVGHQRAIAIGLQYIFNEITNLDFVAVMDADGEDIPEQLNELLDVAQRSGRITFAQRKKRNESIKFKTGYFFYKKIFHFLTRQSINFGNYSVIPAAYLKKIVFQNNIWNHYSGSIIQSKLPYERVLLDRGTRYKGISKMNFNNLVLHGLSSISIYFDYLSIKILKYSVYGIGICVISVLIILYQKIFTDAAIPGWASSLIMIITGLILQLFSVTLIVLLMQLSSRKNITVPDAGAYKGFIDDTDI